MIRNSTVASNTATEAAGGIFAFTYGGGGGAGVEMVSSIAADNTAAGAGTDSGAPPTSPGPRR